MLLRALQELYVTTEHRNLRGKIMRLFKTERDKQYVAELFRKTLDGHERQLPSRTVAAYEGHVAVADAAPPDAERFADVGRFVIGFYRKDDAGENGTGSSNPCRGTMTIEPTGQRC